MRVFECEQGSAEWFAARLGIPSASMYDKIVTAKGDWSTQANGYINQLVAEELTGERVPIFQNQWMLRGVELEPEARNLYIQTNQVKVHEMGFILHDDIDTGCSPDGLIGRDGGLEIKCPAPATHVEYLRGGKLPNRYKQQVMGCLWVTDRQWWDFMSYHPDMKPLIVRVERDEEYIASLAKHVTKAVGLIKENVNQFED